MRSGDRLLSCVLGLLLALPGAALAARKGAESAEVLYERAVSTAQDGRFSEAAGLFDEAATRFPAGHPLHALSLYGAARANQRLDTSEAACKAINRFGEFMALSKIEKEKRRIAQEGVAELTPKCDHAPSEASRPISGSPDERRAGVGVVFVVVVAFVVVGLIAASQ